MAVAGAADMIDEGGRLHGLAIRWRWRGCGNGGGFIGAGIGREERQRSGRESEILYSGAERWSKYRKNCGG